LIDQLRGGDALDAGGFFDGVGVFSEQFRVEHSVPQFGPVGSLYATTSKANLIKSIAVEGGAL
jgi:hypothetical protein